MKTKSTKFLAVIFSMVIIIGSVFCPCTEYTANAGTKPGAEKESKETGEQQLSNDLSSVYDEYNDQMTSLQDSTQTELDNMYKAFINESNKIIESNNITSFIFAYAKLKKEYYVSLYKLVVDRVPAANKIIIEFKSNLNKITKNYKQYGMKHKDVLKKANAYLATANVTEDKQSIKNSISDMKTSITDTLKEYMSFNNEN